MRKIERKNLLSHLNSDYVEAWSAMNASPRTLVYVEGWDDVAFWRSVFDDFEQGSRRRFEVMTPARSDMAKGKKVVLGFADRAGKGLILCVDSDFDYLFDQATVQSRLVNNHPCVVQTYTYAIENLLCLPSSLGSVAAKATKNDMPIFDFEEFFARYSEVVYPLFLWYAYSSRIDRPNNFTLSDFRNTVRINYLHLEDNGERTLEWLERQVQVRLGFLERKYPKMAGELSSFEQQIKVRGVEPRLTHLFMQGHTLLDNVVKVVLQTVCNELRNITIQKIGASKNDSLTKRNEIGSYNNSIRDIDTVIADNTAYKKSNHYLRIVEKIRSVVDPIA